MNASKSLIVLLACMALLPVWTATAQTPAPTPAPAAAPAPAPAPPPAPAAPAPAPAAPAAAPAAPPPAPPLTDIRQVQVKVWISETDERGVREIGANLRYTRFVRGKETNGSVQQVNSTLIPSSRYGTVTMPFPDKTLFGPPLRPDLDNNLANGLQDYSGAGINYTILDTSDGTINGALAAIEHRSDADLISKPELLVANGLPAIIKAGGSVPFQDAKVTPPYPAQLQVAWKDVGVNMNMTPSILPNNMVQLTLTELQVSDVNQIQNLNGVDMPTFSTRSQTGVVMVPDGSTLVIGGLTSRVVRGTEQRVPILGKIPLLGIPFRYRKSDAETRSLLVFVSPTVVDLRAPTDAAKNALDFWKEHGSEWSNTNQIRSEVDAMQSGL